MKKDKVKKLPKYIDQTFVDSIQALNSDDLKARIVQLQVQNEENEQFKESPQYLEAQQAYAYAKESHDLVVGPVKEATAVIKARTRLIVKRLQERGGA